MTNLRDVYPDASESARLSALHRGLLNRGFILGSACLAAISTANTVEEIDELADAIEDTLREMRVNDPGQ